MTGTDRGTTGTARLIASVTLAMLSLPVTLGCVYWAAHPGPSGEWAALAVPLAYLVGIPLGGAALLLVGLEENPRDRPRRYARWLAIGAVLVPFFVHLIRVARR